MMMKQYYKLIRLKVKLDPVLDELNEQFRRDEKLERLGHGLALEQSIEMLQREMKIPENVFWEKRKDD